MQKALQYSAKPAALKGLVRALQTANTCSAVLNKACCSAGTGAGSAVTGSAGLTKARCSAGSDANTRQRSSSFMLARTSTCVRSQRCTAPKQHNVCQVVLHLTVFGGGTNRAASLQWCPGNGQRKSGLGFFDGHRPVPHFGGWAASVACPPRWLSPHPSAPGRPKTGMTAHNASRARGGTWRAKTGTTAHNAIGARGGHITCKGRDESAHASRAKRVYS